MLRRSNLPKARDLGAGLRAVISRPCKCRCRYRCGKFQSQDLFASPPNDTSTNRTLTQEEWKVFVTVERGSILWARKITIRGAKFVALQIVLGRMMEAFPEVGFTAEYVLVLEE